MKNYFQVLILMVGFLLLGPESIRSAQQFSDLGHFSTQDSGNQVQSLDRSEIIRLLEEYLSKSTSDQRITVRVKEILGYVRIPLPAGTLSWEIKIPQRSLQSHLAVSLILFVDGQRLQEMRLQATVEAYANVLIARHSVKRHQILEEKDVQWVNRNIVQSPSDVITDLAEVLGKRLTLSLNGQEILRKSMVEIPPVVKRGDRVMLVVENGQFKITTQGEAREEGRGGDRIRVVNIASKKEVYGRVVDGRTIQVDF